MNDCINIGLITNRILPISVNVGKMIKMSKITIKELSITILFMLELLDRKLIMYENR